MSETDIFLASMLKLPNVKSSADPAHKPEDCSTVTVTLAFSAAAIGAGVH